MLWKVCIICLPRPWLTVPSKYSIVCHLPALNPYNGLMLCNAVISSHDISTVSKYTQYTIACHSVAWGCAKAQLLRRVQGYGIKKRIFINHADTTKQKTSSTRHIYCNTSMPKNTGKWLSIIIFKWSSIDWWSANTRTFSWSFWFSISK